MHLYLVLVLAFDGMSEPWGIYSNIDKAMQAQEDCQALHDPTWHAMVKLDFGTLLHMESCEIWEYELDGKRISYAPRPKLPQPEISKGGIPAID